MALIRNDNAHKFGGGGAQVRPNTSSMSLVHKWHSSMSDHLLNLDGTIAAPTVTIRACV